MARQVLPRRGPLAGTVKRVADRRYRDYLAAELETAAMYQALADREKDPDRAEVFRKLVAAEMRHARHWAEKLSLEPPPPSPGQLRWQRRIVLSLARWLGTKRILPFLLRGEARDIRAYASDPETAHLATEERQHSRLLQEMAGERDPLRLLAVQGLHPLADDGTLRAAVLGVNDGLVSNFGLVMGVAGASQGGEVILLAGTAGLVAGAFSMAAGEYVSVRSQRDVYEHQIRIEQAELREFPEEEQQELALLYQAKGLPREEAERIAGHLMSRPELALDTKVREELGLNPVLLGSPWKAAFSSFVSFCMGAVVPLIPYIVEREGISFWPSAGASGGALLLVGSALAVLAGRNAAWGGFRMLMAGSAAAAVTFGIGRLVGASILS